MRIHRIHLQHVAGVDDRELAFGDGVTVVVGPNEAGKSTIATALQLLLEEKDRYDNERIRMVRPVHADADPTIELECTTGPYHVTYRKCFGSTPSRRETTLTVHAPTPESLTGDAAHDRMRAILDETVDEQLWSALRVQQRHDVGQADLAASGALAAALDAAGAGTPSLTDDETLVARVEQATAEFWTDTGKERKPLKEADAAVTAAADEVAEAEAKLAAVRDATAQHDRLVAQLDTWRAALPDLQARAKETAESLAEVTAQRDALTAATQQVEIAEAAATRAHDAVGDRAVLVARLGELGALVADAEDAAQRAATLVQGAEERVAAARADRDQARARLDEAQRSLRAAEADVRLLRLDGDVTELTTRIELAEELHERREGAKARLDDSAPSAADIRRLERLDEAVRTTAAVLEADLPRVRVTGPADAAVTVGGEALDLGEQGVERTVDGELTVVVGEVTVAVAPGATATELADAHADARHALQAALEQTGATDLAAARARREAAQEARRELDQTEAAWARVTAVDGLDGLRASLDRTRADVDRLREARPAGRPLPDDASHADELVATARDEVDGAQAAVTTAETAVEAASEAAAGARTAAAESTVRLETARTRLEEATERLATARASASDEQLGEAAAAADQEVVAATRTRDRAEAALAALDVQTIEADADAARARLEATRRQLQEADLERARLWGTVEASASSGLGERVPQLRAELADAESRRDALRHRAEALKLLRDTLHAHRDAARARYQAPLQREVERLGRVVFGEGFAVELDEHLRVIRRTLDGRTLELDQLSGGAQEQLAIITRLAAASLVDEVDGVPLILDDALGYADPTRTDRVSTLLATVGRSSQVIVLTCDPDRFAGVPDATLLAVG